MSDGRLKPRAYFEKHFHHLFCLTVILCLCRVVISLLLPMAWNKRWFENVTTASVYNVLYTVSTQQYLSTVIYAIRSHYDYMFQP